MDGRRLEDGYNWGVCTVWFSETKGVTREFLRSWSEEYHLVCGRTGGGFTGVYDARNEGGLMEVSLIIMSYIQSYKRQLYSKLWAASRLRESVWRQMSRAVWLAE
ncbi:hypothetical protein V6N13_091000 [Hibiscus sabdariffa]